MSRPFVPTVEKPKPEEISGYRRADMRDATRPGDWKSW
jgi:hypothetical protein